MTEEQKLLLALQSHKEEALEAAIRTYTPYLSTVLYRTVGSLLSREDTEEITADVFFSVWQNAVRIDPKKGSLRAYMAGVARNQAIERLRSKKEICSLDAPDAELLPGVSYPPPNPFLWEAVAELGEEDLEIFVRFYRYRESLKEISRAMGMNLSTVKTRLSRGKKKLKQLLNPEEST